jgi:hypothetical protein
LPETGCRKTRADHDTNDVAHRDDDGVHDNDDDDNDRDDG